MPSGIGSSGGVMAAHFQRPTAGIAHTVSAMLRNVKGLYGYDTLAAGFQKRCLQNGGVNSILRSE